MFGLGNWFRSHPKNWGRPSPYFDRFKGEYVSGGIVWRGGDPPTSADWKALHDYYGSKVLVDTRSLVGRKDPDWDTAFYEYRRNNKEIIKL